MSTIHTNVVVPTLCVHSPLDSTAKLNYTYRNKIINGGFDVWQRGASFALLAADYTADRWLVDLIGQVTRESFLTGESELMDNARYYLKTHHDGSTPASLEQRIESVRTFAGKQTTLTFWAKSGIPDSVLNVYADQSFGDTIGVPEDTPVTTVIDSVTLHTVWTKHTLSVTLPSIAGKSIGSDANDYLAIRFVLPIDDVYLCNVQFEKGPLATNFEQRPLDEEIRLCKRFFEQIDCASLQHVMVGVGISGTQANFILPYAEKRVAPEITVPSLIQIYGNAITPVWSDFIITKNIGNKIASVESDVVSGAVVVAVATGTCSILIDAEL